MKIVILERGTVGSDVSVEPLCELGEVQVYENSRPEQVAGRIAGADIVIANKMPLNEETLSAAPNVRLICQFATGYDNVDTAYCRERGIAVCNVSDYSTASVVQHTFAMALYLSEHLPYYDHYVKSGAYAAQDRFTCFDRSFSELEGKTWGIVGMGHIGRRVAACAAAFGCRVLWSSTNNTRRNEGYEQVDLPDLLSRSDYLSLHCPLNEKTHHLIDDAALSCMKPTAILINAARGAVVDNAALCHALQASKIAAAALDVVEGEPISPSNPLNALFESERLLITPHMAWASVEARTRVVSEARKNIEAFLRGEQRNRIV